MVDASIAGEWLIMNARVKEWSDRYVEGRGHVRGGRVIAEFSRLTPGNLYRYRLVDKSGRVLSSGNFFLLTSRMRSEVEEAAWRKGGRAEPGTVAWLDTLADFGLDWDAYQGIRRLE